MIGYFNGYVLFPLLEKLKKREILTKLDKLRAYEELTIEQQMKAQKESLHKLLTYCNKHIPFYKNLFQENNFQIDKVLDDIKYLHELPILTKKDIKTHYEQMKKKSEWLFTRKTGGSTGQSVYFYYDRSGLDWTAAINLYALEMAGKKRHHRDIHISSELGLEKPPWKSKIQDTIKLFSQNRKRLMITSFTDKNLKEMYSTLKSYKPYLLQGHPSSVYAIAEYIAKEKLSLRKLCDVFEPSGEMLTDKIVNSIERNLGCKVVNRYGNAEFGVIAHSKPTDSYNKLKVFNSAFYVEDCDQSNLIITNLANYGFPLLRYDTGDVGTVKTESNGTYIYDIQGRIHDTVEINNEDFATHYIMDYLDHRVKHIREFQIILTNSTPSPVLAIVPEKENDEERISKLIKERWNDGLNLKFIKHDELKLVGWRQKFRHVIDQRD